MPYGIYDLVHNQGYVYVGTSHDTAAFAVAAIVRWFERQDRPKFADETKILILSDSGGSNGYRVRNWKYQLQQQLADQFNIEVMVCHYPSGASKWNPIEHRLFSFISLNWAGKPLRSLRWMTALIRGTTTSTGLIVKAAQLKGHYPTKASCIRCRNGNYEFDTTPDLSTMELSLSSPPAVSSKCMKLFLYKP